MAYSKAAVLNLVGSTAPHRFQGFSELGCEKNLQLNFHQSLIEI
jgi:hypothetical protein